ncbi:hypothetical protein [Bradyrhizobium sp. Ai1a-2]|uniref:hypothetical protein n=1 Tax=Bradyrhizobium sp. Ai1a-2 TaxID=196490 RepID=UPI00048997DA|nr:hypothetical protein [Bradyrhizobium sp. Ai1a-2]
MRNHPDSSALPFLLDRLSYSPAFIETILSSLLAAAGGLGVIPADASLAMSVDLFCLGAPLLPYRQGSDRLRRKPIEWFGSILVRVDSMRSRPVRQRPPICVLRGAGTSATEISSVAVVGEPFDGAIARAKMPNVVRALNTAPIVARTVGTALLGFDPYPWWTVYLVPIAARMFRVWRSISNESVGMDSNK